MSNLINFKCKKRSVDVMEHEGRLLVVDFIQARIDKEWYNNKKEINNYYYVIDFNHEELSIEEKRNLQILKSLEEQFKKVS